MEKFYSYRKILIINILTQYYNIKFHLKLAKKTREERREEKITELKDTLDKLIK